MTSERGIPSGSTAGLDADELVAAMPGLLRYARTMTADEALAEDLVQATMVRALERGHGFDGRSSLATWLHRILHNVFVDQMRRRRELPAEDIWEQVESQWRDPAFTLDTVEIVEAVAVTEHVRESLLRVPVMYRSAIVLHDMVGLTVPEVAAVQRISLPAAKQRVRRGRLMLVSSLSAAAERRHAMRGVPMDCWDARLLVSDYLDRTLPQEQVLMLESHVERCPTCPPLVSALVTSTQAVSDLQDTDSVIPTDLAARLAEHAQTAAQSRGEGG